MNRKKGKERKLERYKGKEGKKRGKEGMERGMNSFIKKIFD